MSYVKSSWKYYIPDDGEKSEDAINICHLHYQKIYEAESAARLAAEDEWCNHDGWERGITSEFIMVVISPSGVETKFNISRETSVDHNVTKVEDND